MSKCVLCLGNWRKQTFQAEILISELQSKLWKWHLRALSPGPHHPWRVRNTSRKHALLTHTHTDTHTYTHPPSERPNPRADRSSISHRQMDTLLIGVPASFVLTNTMVQICFCALSLGPCCACSLKARFSSKLVLLLVSGTFFFPTSEINEISISHLTQTDYAFFFFRISDIWSNANLFSYVTFSNNWALALAEPVSIISERGKVHIFTLLHVNRRDGTVTRIPLLTDCFWTHPETSLWRLLGW